MGYMIDTGLGWEADSEFCIYAADTPIGRIINSSFNPEWKKGSSGYALAAFVISDDGYWYQRGPLLISSDPDNITITGAGNPASGTIRIINQTWYWNWQYITYNTWGPYGPKEYDSQGLPQYHCAIASVITNAQIYDIVRNARVIPHISQRAVAFAAGMAAGLATRAWALREHGA